MASNQEFVRLWTQHTRRIYAYLLTLVHNRTDADDLLQETGAALWEKFDQFEPGTNFFAWACRTAYYCVSNFRRRQGSSPQALDDELLEVLDREFVTAGDDADLQLSALVHCLEKLRPRDRDLVARRYRAEATMQTLSTEVGRSVDALYKAMQRIHESLYECVRQRMAEEASS